MLEGEVLVPGTLFIPTSLGRRCHSMKRKEGPGLQSRCQEVAMGQWREGELQRCCGVSGPLWGPKDTEASSGGENPRSEHAKARKRHTFRIKATEIRRDGERGREGVG